MTHGPPWRQKIVPRTFKCKRTGRGCASEKCPLYSERYKDYVDNFDTCEHREMEK